MALCGRCYDRKHEGRYPISGATLGTEIGFRLICDALLYDQQHGRRPDVPKPASSTKHTWTVTMPEMMQDLLLKYPPREIDPGERQDLDEWFARASDVSAAYVSRRRADDPALYKRIVIAVGPGDEPTHLIHAPIGVRLWLKLTLGGEPRVEMFDTLGAALNSIRRVLD
jgi:hypothetical protein